MTDHAGSLRRALSSTRSPLRPSDTLGREQSPLRGSPHRLFSIHENWTQTEHKDSSDEWRTAHTPGGRVYFYNRITRVSAWRLPSSAAVADTPSTIRVSCTPPSLDAQARQRDLQNEGAYPPLSPEQFNGYVMTGQSPSRRLTSPVSPSQLFPGSPAVSATPRHLHCLACGQRVTMHSFEEHFTQCVRTSAVSIDSLRLALHTAATVINALRPKLRSAQSSRTNLPMPSPGYDARAQGDGRRARGRTAPSTLPYLSSSGQMSKFFCQFCSSSEPKNREELVRHLRICLADFDSEDEEQCERLATVPIEACPYCALRPGAAGLTAHLSRCRNRVKKN